MSAGLSFVFTYWNFAFVCPLISFTLFSINTGSIFVLEIQCNTHCESVIKMTVSNGSLSCVPTYFKHLTPINTARSSSLGIVILLTGAILLLQNIKSDFVSFNDFCNK